MKLSLKGAAVDKGYMRKMSFNERTYVATDSLCPPVANQFVFDGEGVLDPYLWRTAVAVASEANPGARLILKGHLAWSRWIDSGNPPRVREIDGSRWDGHGPEGAPVLLEPLPFRESPICEVILVHGPVPRVVFRTHHGVMDGRGTLCWAEDVFRALRKENVMGSTSTLTEVQMAESFQKQFRRAFPVEHIAPTGLPEGDARGVIWKRRSIKGKVPLLLPRCARFAAEEAWRHAEGIVRFAVAVDMRPRRPELRSTGNLTLDLYVEINKNTTPELIADDMAYQLRHGFEGRIKKYDQLVKYIPLRLVRFGAQKMIRDRHRKGRYGLSGIFSNLGRVDLNFFCGGGFSARSFWAVPPATEYFPFFLVLSGYEGGSELVLSVPKNLGSAGRLDDALECIARKLEQVTR